MRWPLILLFLLGGPLFAPPSPPVDERRLNEFAAAYNAYVVTLGKGEINLRLWRDVQRQWDNLK
jgi:hypothetical protein